MILQIYNEMLYKCIISNILHNIVGQLSFRFILGNAMVIRRKCFENIFNCKKYNYATCHLIKWKINQFRMAETFYKFIKKKRFLYLILKRATKFNENIIKNI